MNMFKKIGKGIKSFFSKAGKVVTKFAKWAFTEVLVPSVQDALSPLLEDAVAVVGDLDASDITNADKRRLAFDRIKELARGKEITIRDAAINLLIEMAVTRLKNIKDA